MGVPTSEVGYTSAMPRREVHEVHKRTCGGMGEKKRVMFKVSPAGLQTFIDTSNCVLEDRVQYSTVHIPNVFSDGRLQIINCVGIVRIH
jgi:hypothetical protein